MPIMPWFAWGNSSGETGGKKWKSGKHEWRERRAAVSGKAVSSEPRSPQGPRSSEQPPTRSAVLPRLSRVCSAALWIFAPQTSRPFSYNPCRVSRCVSMPRGRKCRREIFFFFFIFLSPFCDSQMWVARGGEPASGSRPRRGRSCCWWEGGRPERLARSEMLHCCLLPFPPARRRRDFNHLRARRKSMGGIRLISTCLMYGESSVARPYWYKRSH